MLTGPGGWSVRAFLWTLAQATVTNHTSGESSGFSSVVSLASLCGFSAWQETPIVKILATTWGLSHAAFVPPSHLGFSSSNSVFQNGVRPDRRQGHKGWQKKQTVSFLCQEVQPKDRKHFQIRG